jgi:hypothetical protein
VAHVRDRIYRALTERTTLEVLLDVRMLGGGDVWRPILHQWLGECDSAVLLLSSEALASSWVQTEATILTWRRSLGSQLTVVPVRIGCSRKDVVDNPAFTPLDLGNIQFEALDHQGDLATLDITDAGQLAALDAAVDGLVETLLTRLQDLEVDNDELPMRRWVHDVTQVLAPIPDGSVVDAAEELGVTAETRANVRDLRLVVAHRLLTATLGELYRALRALRPRLMGEGQYRYLIDLVVPVWVSALAGRNFLDAYTGAAGARMVAINARREETGLHYLARATCGQADASQTVTVNDVTGTNPDEELLVRYQRALWRETGLSEPFDAHRLARYLADDEGQQFVLIGPDAAAPALEPGGGAETVLAQLAGFYREAVFVILAGGTLWEHATNFEALTRVTPELAEREEEDVEVTLVKIDRLSLPGLGRPVRGAR